MTKDTGKTEGAQPECHYCGQPQGEGGLVYSSTEGVAVRACLGCGEALKSGRTWRRSLIDRILRNSAWYFLHQERLAILPIDPPVERSDREHPVGLRPLTGMSCWAGTRPVKPGLQRFRNRPGCVFERD